MEFGINISIKKKNNPGTLATRDPKISIVTPGDMITADTGFMKGHGTYVAPDTSIMYASLAGSVERVNKLITVRPLKARYSGEIGDVIVGRILEVQQKRWKVETNSRLDSFLQLSAVNLPGGELRRRSEEDERMMRQYLKENDLISAEVQSISHDGTLNLHTRNLKYGKLGQGTLLKVPSSLIKRRKSHFHNLPIGASIILGNNGYVWISPTSNEEKASGEFGHETENFQSSDFEVVARLANCVEGLIKNNLMLYDTSIMYAYEESLKYEQVKELLDDETIEDIAIRTRQRLQMEGAQ